MSQPKSKERASVDSILDAVVAGRVRINPDGWMGSTLRIQLEHPTDTLTNLRNSFQQYASAEENQRDELAKSLYSKIINVRMGGLLVGETVPEEMDRLMRENAKLKDDMKRLLDATTGQDSQGEAPYQ